MPLLDLHAYVRDVPNFPKPGILFRDLTPLCANGAAFAQTIDALAAWARPHHPERIVGIEARGFIFGAAVASRLGVGFVPIRKPGKLPWSIRQRRYELEYGSDAIEMHDDAVSHGAPVVLIDDLLATGGTAAAAVHLLRESGAQVAAALFVAELVGLAGRLKLSDASVQSLLTFP